MNFVIPGSAALWMPERLAPSTWLGHIPFAFWLVTTHQPKVVVELGTHNGSSYMAFCQAIERSGFAASAYAIDTWRGDEQTGFYGEDVFADVTAYHDRRYLAFSRLVRSTFDQALDHFADGSIELLHIDGFHAYGAVKHDFDAWRPKLSDRAIVLMHDINVRERGFGVWRLWEELIVDHPHFAFQHHHGLGVLGIGSDPPPALRSLIEATADESDAVELRTCFARLGNGIQAQFDAERLLSVQDHMAGEARADRAALASAGAERDRLRTSLAESQAHFAKSQAQLAEAQAEIAQLGKRVVAVQAELATSLDARVAVQRKLDASTAAVAAAQRNLNATSLALRKERRRRAKLLSSISWQATRPLRSIVDFVVRPFRKARAKDELARADSLNLPPLLPPYFQPALKPTTPVAFDAMSWLTRTRATRTKVCCLIHIYYPDSWPEIAAYLKNLHETNHEIFINFVETTVTDELLAQAAADFPAATQLVSPNRGRDAGGLFRLVTKVDLSRYASVLVIHGKRSIHIKPEYGDLWRRTLIEPLIGSPTIARLNAALIATDSTVGMIGSAACHSTFVGANASSIAMLGQRLGIAPEDLQAPFVAGSMFFIRPTFMARMLEALRGLDFLDPHRPDSVSSIDGDLEHAVERVYGALVKSAKQRIVWRDTRVTKVDLGPIGTAKP